MSQPGGRGPAVPPKAPAPLAPKVASPVAPPVVAKPVAGAPRPRVESNAAMSPGPARVLVAAAVAHLDDTHDDAWDSPPAKVEPDALPAAPTATDVGAIVKHAVDEALAPVADAFRRLEQRIDDLERRRADYPISPAAAPATAAAPLAVVAEARIALAAPPPATYAPRVPDIPIETSTSYDFDVPFDGRRRKRRVAILFTLVILVLLGTPLGILIHSYMR